MTSPLWHSPAVVVLSSPPAPSLESLRNATADAIVLEGPDAALHVPAVAAVRPDLALIALADIEEAEALELIAGGADEVLGRTATMAEVMRAIRHAISRRRRRGRAWGGRLTTIPGAPHQLQAVGRLAAGLGHEFNNLFVVIDGNAELLRDRLPEGHSLKQAADAIVKASERAGMLTKQLLAFGRQQTLVPAQTDLNAVVADAAAALGHAMGKHVRVVTRLGDDLPQVHVDTAQIKEVLTNLAATALEAMPLGGTFSIETDSFAVGEEERRHREWLPRGPYLRLQVSDTGLGVEEQALPHLFEPFFAPDDATRPGLAMSSVYGIVKQSGGYIWVDSQINQGTRVTILLPPIGNEDRPPPAGRRPADPNEATPVSDENSSPHATAPPPAPAPVMSTASTPRVLLVEDIDSVREILKNLLEIHDFVVIPAPTAEDALELARSRGFDVVLTDVALPGRSGPELARDIRKMYPETPVLFMSGHPANSIDPRDLEDARGGFLQKPFSAATLVQRLNDLLGTKSDRRSIGNA